ncbi:hypothetical protein OS493_037970 [Desmophyllum pertusum]|uniref:Uncharacterized protein n=1 Tax=Desmophyllum pertusum TaxID=174260 RepID=A0A9X0CCI4_9CNID|nr:hypothetical protein OS493_037970 [Desmophyllum pertusum]
MLEWKVKQDENGLFKCPQDVDSAILIAIKEAGSTETRGTTADAPKYTDVFGIFKQYRVCNGIDITPLYRKRQHTQTQCTKRKCDQRKMAYHATVTCKVISQFPAPPVPFTNISRSFGVSTSALGVECQFERN